MNQKLINVLLFTAGAAIGSLVTWKVLERKYEQIVKEEIESVKETWARLGEDSDDDNEETEAQDNEEEDHQDELTDEEFEQSSIMMDYSRITSNYRSSSERKTVREGAGDDDIPYINGPQVISPDEYGDGNYGHDLYSFTYYADGVLADDWWVKQDIEETIGEEALEHFGDYEEDVVHVRNERTRCDYEVVRDCRTYVDVMTGNPLIYGHET